VRKKERKEGKGLHTEEKLKFTGLPSEEGVSATAPLGKSKIENHVHGGSDLSEVLGGGCDTVLI
jgi:hypothetical protein